MQTDCCRSITEFTARFDHNGFALAENIIPPNIINELIAARAEIPGEDSRRTRNAYGIRNLLELSPTVCSLAKAPRMRALAEAVLGAECFAVRALLFDKLPGTN